MNSPDEAATTGTTEPYWAHIDGLRAIAVISVLLHHIGLGCSGGYVGVDVFFVISGYLITSQLKRLAEIGPISLTDFWCRRIRRLGPALFATVMANFALCWFVFLPRDLEALGYSMVCQALLISNFYFWKAGNYFALSGTTRPLLHTWSLAIEEQFYLFLPLLFYFRPLRPVPGSGNQVAVRRCLWVLLWLLLPLAIVATPIRPAASYFALPTRAWELLIGCLLAYRFPDLTATSTKPRLESLCRFLGWLMISLAIFLYRPGTLFPGLAATLPCFGAGLLLVYGGRGYSEKLLCWAPLRQIGKMSYSLYLVHWPLICLGQTLASQPGIAKHNSLFPKWGILGMSLLLGWLSYLAIERPARQWLMGRTRRTLVFGLGTTLVILAVAATTILMGGFPGRLPASIRAEIERLSMRNENTSFRIEHSLFQARAGQFTHLGDPTSPPTLMVWGDSHASAMLPAVHRLCKKAGKHGFGATRSACPPVIDEWILSESGADTKPYNQAILDQIIKQKIPNVLLVGSWDKYLRPENGAALEIGLKRTISALKSSGIKVFVLQDAPMQSFDPRILGPQQLWSGGRSWKEFAQAKEDYLARPSRKLISEWVSKDDLLDPLEQFFPAGQERCRMELEDRTLVYRDAGHLSNAGSDILIPVLQQMLDRCQPSLGGKKD